MKLKYFLPAFIRHQIDKYPGLARILDNIGWLFIDKIIRMGVGLIVGVWIARYLGPVQFGQLNFAIAFVSIFSVISALGLNEIVVRDLVNKPETVDITIGTAFVMQIICSLIAISMIMIIMIYIRPDDNLTRIIVAILSLSLIFKTTEVIRYWFESQVQSRYGVWVDNFAFLLMSVVKVVLIITQSALIYFAWAILVEAILVAFGLLTIYSMKCAKLRNWQPRIVRAKILLKDSLPLLMSGIAIMIYMRIDQIMIGEMIGDDAVGIYTAAVRISEVWYFIPMVIVSSVFPSIIQAKKRNESFYLQRLQKLYNLLVLISLLIVAPMTFLSDWIILFLFGKNYSGAGSVLAIHIWASIFVALGVASGKWYLIENMSSYLFYRTIISAIINVVLNYCFIPKYGINGAAIATLLSYFVAGLLFDVFVKKARLCFYMKINSLFLRWIYVH